MDGKVAMLPFSLNLICVLVSSIKKSGSKVSGEEIPSSSHLKKLNFTPVYTNYNNDCPFLVGG